VKAPDSLTAAAIVRLVLQKYGVTSVFALAGASQSLLLDDCDRNGIRVIPTRHETATVGAADGYSRVMNRIGVAMVNVDQGLPNTITGLQAALESCSPVLLLVGREPDGATEPEHEIDHDALYHVRPLVKWARTVRDPARLAEYVDAACRRALSGRQGPVVVAFDKDFLSEAVEATVDLSDRSVHKAMPVASKVDVARAVELITKAERPMIIAGTGAAKAGAGPVLRRLAETFHIPVVTSALGRGLVAEDDELGWSWLVALPAAAEADLVMWAGIRMGQRFGYGLAPRFAADAHMVQIDVDADGLGRNRSVDVAIHADARLALDQIEASLADKELPPFDDHWLRKALRERLDQLAARGQSQDDRVDPVRLGREVMEAMPPDAIVVGDGASILVRNYTTLRIKSEGGYMDTFPLGSVGTGTALAMGAVVASQDKAKETGGTVRPVVLITGDGAFGYYASELGSASLAGLPFVTVIANNGVWGNEYHTQPFQIGRRLNADLGDLRYDLVAQGYGCIGRRVENVQDLRPALDEAFAANEPSVLDVLVSEPLFDRADLLVLENNLKSYRSTQFGSA
jgi:acetolactate synthase-1/2/3 large subunit